MEVFKKIIVQWKNSRRKLDMEIHKKELVYVTEKISEDYPFYQIEDDCEDFKVFVNKKNEVFLLRNIKN
jgi:enolase